jgi:hypothetical protein
VGTMPVSDLTVLPPHPVMRGENRHCTHLAVHCASLVTLEGDTTKSVHRDPRDSDLSVRPRPGLDTTGKEGRHGTALWVTSASHPLRHHGVQGWPSILRARRYSHLNRDRQNIISRLPVVLASSRPIKGQARILQRGERDNKEIQETIRQTQDRDQYLKQSPWSSFFSL